MTTEKDILNDKNIGTPSEGHCWICFRDETEGLMIKDSSVGGYWVHVECLNWFGVDTCAQWERQYIDPL